MSQQVKKIVSKITCVIMAAVFFVAGSFTFQEEYRALDNGALICETGGVEKLAACLDELGLTQLTSYDSSKHYVFYHNGEEGQFVILEIEETSELRLFMYPTGGNMQLCLMAYDGYIDSYKVWLNDYALNPDVSNYWYFETYETNVNPSSFYGQPIGSIWVESCYDYKYFDDGGFHGIIYSDVNVVLEAYLCKTYGWNWQSYIVNFDKYDLSATGSDYDKLVAQLDSVGISSLPADFKSTYNHMLVKCLQDGQTYYYLYGFDSLDLVDINMYRYKDGDSVYLTSNIQPLDSVFSGFYVYKFNTSKSSWSLLQSTSTRFSLGSYGYIATDSELTGMYENCNLDEIFLYSDFNLYFSGAAVSEFGWPAVLYADTDFTLTDEAPEDSGSDSGTDRPSEGGTEIEDSGSSDDIVFDKPDLNDDAIGNVGAAEDNLLKPGKDLDVEGALDVSIDPNAAKFIWDTVELFVASNESIFTLVIAMLSLGVVALILGR